MILSPAIVRILSTPLRNAIFPAPESIVISSLPPADKTIISPNVPPLIVVKVSSRFPSPLMLQTI